MAYLKYKPSNHKFLLLSRGVKRNFGSKIEQKFSSAIKKKLYICQEKFKASTVNINLSVLRRTKRHVTRNRNMIVTIGERTSLNTINKSRNWRLDSRISKLSMPTLNSQTPVPQRYKKTVVMCPKRK